MNFKNLFFVTILIPSILSGMDTTFQTPSIAFAKPRFARKNLTTVEMYASLNKANSTYNGRGNLVPYLSFAGPELLLKRFVDTTLPVTDTQNFGYATFTGGYHADKINVGFTQNIGQNWFINGHTNIIWQQYYNLQIQPLNANGCPLTGQEIDAIVGLRSYLQNLQESWTSSSSLCTQTIGPSYFTFGYTNSLQHFKHLDFLDVTVQTGLWIPEIFHNGCHNTIFQPLPNKMYNFGIPIQINTTVGLYDWLNIGGCALLIPFINSQQMIPINTNNNSCNTFLIDQTALCSIHSNPFLYLNAYVEAEQFVPNVTLLAGISYIKQGATQISCLQSNVQNSACTTNIKPWEICNLTLSLEFDLAKEKSHVMPRITFTYVRPLWGVNAFHTCAYAGQFGIEIRWDF